MSDSERRRTRRLAKQLAEHVADTATLPVTSYREAAFWLRRPFTAEAVRFRVMEVAPKGEPTSGIVCAYIDARLVVERLNLVCPDLWAEDYVRVGGHLWCSLTIDGLTRRDIGDGYSGKGLVSDALKRAAVKFGVGVSLYATPRMAVELDDGRDSVRESRERGAPWLTLTRGGVEQCRNVYRAWLLSTGLEAFGEPIDHGDVAESQGDVEIAQPAPPQSGRQRTLEPPEAPPEPVSTPAPPEPPADPEAAAKRALAELLAITKDGLAPARHAAEAAMVALGFAPAQRLAELKGAKDERGLDALVQRLHTITKISTNEDNERGTGR